MLDLLLIVADSRSMAVLGRLVVLAIVGHAAVARADSPPRIEDALAEAARAGKPLVVEFGARWCAPCRALERDVLPRPDVQAALAGLAFVRYDLDEPPGDAAAGRYHVSEVPTFLVLASDGRELARHTGSGRPVLMASTLIELFNSARSRVLTSIQLEQAVANDPLDVDARIRLADHYRATGRRADAVAQLRAVLALPSLDHRRAAELTATANELEAAELRLQRWADDALAFVDACPETARATERIADLIASGRVPRARIHDLVHAHLIAVPPVRVPDAVRVAVLAGELDEAQAALVRAEADDVAELGAELLLARAPAKARAQIDRLCRAPRPDHRLACYALREAVRGHARLSPATRELAERARRRIAALEQPGGTDDYVSLAGLGSAQRALGEALVGALDDARARCASLVDRKTHAHVYFGSRPRDTSVTVTPPARRLEACLHDRLVRARRVPLPDRLRMIMAHLELAPATPGSEPAAEDLEAAPPLAPRGVLFDFAARSGDLDASMGATALYDPIGGGPLRLITGGELALGGPDTSTYVARGVVGVAIRTRLPTVLLTTGFGVSRFGDDVPAATEIPVGLRARFVIGPVRAHLWLALSTVLGSAARGRMTPFDESAAGVAASVPLGDVRVLIGAGFESRRAGNVALLSFGVPFGSYF